MQPRIARIVLTLYLAAIYATLGVVRIVSNFLRDRHALRPTVLVAFGIATAGLLSLIFRERRNRTWRTAAALAVASIAYAVVILPMELPEEKIHFIEYGLVGLLADLASPRSWTSSRRYALCSAFVLGAGWTDELIQGILPNRYYDLRDVAFNAAAGMMALTLIAALRSITRQRSSPAWSAAELLPPRPDDRS